MSDLPFVSFVKHVDSLDDSDILTFEAWDKESQKVLAKKLLPNNDALWLEKAYRTEQEILIKPESIAINHSYNKLTLNTKAGTIATDLADELLEFLAENRQQQFYFEGKLIKKVPKGHHAIYLAEVEKVYLATYDFDTAKQLLSEYRPIDLLMYAIGYKPLAKAIAGKLAMLLPLFKPGNQPIHTVHFTSPRFGKTKTANILRAISNSYATVLPSPAKLIYDGRNGKYGLCYFYGTLFIDEFDKVAGKRKEVFKETYEILLTGMSEGLWQRDVSSKAADFNNVVAFCFMGNTNNADFSSYEPDEFQQDSREKLHNHIARYDVIPEPFVERIAYAEFLATADFQAYKFLNYNDKNLVNYLKPDVARAIVKLLQEDASSLTPIKQPESEIEKHISNVYNVLRLLGVKLELDTVEKLCKGYLTFMDVSDKLGEKSQMENSSESNESNDSLDLLDEIVSFEL